MRHEPFKHGHVDDFSLILGASGKIEKIKISVMSRWYQRLSKFFRPRLRGLFN